MKAATPQSLPEGESSSAGIRVSAAATTKACSVGVKVNNGSGSFAAGAALCALALCVSASPAATAVPAPMRKPRRGIGASAAVADLLFLFSLMAKPPFEVENMSESSTARASARAQPLCLEHRDGGRRGHKLDKNRGCGGLLAVGRDRCRIGRVKLKLRRQRSDQLGADARVGKDFADLGDAELGLAVGNRLGGRIAGGLRLELCFHLIGDAEAVEQALDVWRGCTRLHKSDRLRVKQCMLERLAGRDVGLGRALVGGDAGAGTGDISAAIGAELAFFHEIVGGGGGQDSCVNRLSLLDRGLELGGGPEGYAELVLARLLELGRELFHRRLERIGDHNLELRRPGGAGAGQCERDDARRKRD